MDLKRYAVALLALLASVAVWLAACTPAAAPPPPSAIPDIHLALVAYSTPQEAYARLIPAFQQTPGGAGVSVDPSFGSSGSQTQAVINGLGADIVALSLASDVTRLVGANLIAPEWNADPFHG